MDAKEVEKETARVNEEMNELETRRSAGGNVNKDQKVKNQNKEQWLKKLEITKKEGVRGGTDEGSDGGQKSVRFDESDEAEIKGQQAEAEESTDAMKQEGQRIGPEVEKGCGEKR